MLPWAGGAVGAEGRAKVKRGWEAEAGLRTNAAAVTPRGRIAGTPMTGGTIFAEQRDLCFAVAPLTRCSLATAPLRRCPAARSRSRSLRSHSRFAA